MKKKKRVATLETILVAFYVEFDETKCIFKFLLEKKPLQKKSFES